MASVGSVKTTVPKARKGVATRKPPGPSWTVMVFMGATTFDGNVPLGSAAESDLAEMTAIGSEAGRLNILVERHDNTSASRYHIGNSQPGWTGTPDKKPPAALGDGQALTRFVRDALRQADHRPDDYTMLVLWGHAYEFAFGRRRERDGAVDALDFSELRDRLVDIQGEMFRQWYGEAHTSGVRLPKLDIVGFDACELSSVEMACQLAPCAKYLLGSEIGIPIPGWPYDRILDRVKHNEEDRPMGPAEFGSYIVRRFCESYQAREPVSLTLLDLSYSADLVDRAEWLARMLARELGNPESADHIALLFSQSQTEVGRPYVDVADLCVNLARESSSASIADAATALGDLLVSPRPAVAGLSATGAGRPLVVEHGRNAGALARLHGLSLYAPHVAPETDANAAASLYDKFEFAQQTSWRDLVHTLARL